MLLLLLLAASAVGVLGGSSPHAEYIRETYKVASGARYSNDVIEDALLDVPGLVTKYGYPVESHDVVTSDGYLLTMHRIPHGKERNNQPGPRRVAFLMHGLVSSSADWLVLGSKNGLAYILAEEGYDVWLGNARGNFYSRRHITLDPNSLFNQDFWRFSWDDIGNFDLPAFVDYIITNTKESKIHYIGHSQGGSTFLVLTSLRPEYNEKFISFQGLAPASFFTNNDHALFNNLASLETIIETSAFAMGRAEVFADRDFISWFSDNYCVANSIFNVACNAVSESETSSRLNQTMIPLFLGHAPAGASIRQFAQYAQGIRFNTFRRYNYLLTTGNLAAYGSRTAPDYDLSKITVPSYIYYGLSDTLVHHKDVEILISKLPNVIESSLMDDPLFNHVDFIWGNTVRTCLYDKLVLRLRGEERRQGL